MLESHPGDEGVETANQLSSHHPVTFYYDSEITTALKSADTVFLGADRLHKEGTFTNKVGTNLLCRLSNPGDVRVCTELLKLVPSRLNNTDILIIDSPSGLKQGLKRKHPLFEDVPAELVGQFITEEGTFSSWNDLTAASSDLLDAHRDFSKFLEEDIPGDSNV
ncbi:MAG: hypothetical protein ABEK50_16040 [bacterium]